MAVFINSVDATDLLIKSGASLTYNNDPYFPSYMHYAVLRNFNIVESLLRHGAEFDTKNVRGETPLCSATKYGSVINVNLLISYGADISVKDLDGNNLLHCAVLEERFSIIRSLIEVGINFDAKNMKDFIPLESALMKNLRTAKAFMYFKQIPMVSENSSKSLHQG